MAAALNAQQLAQIEQQLSQNPAILQALQADSKKIGGRFQYMKPNDARARQTPKEVLKAYGIDFPDAADYQILVDPSGQVQLKRSNWFQRNSDWILPVATIGTAGAVSYLAGGAGAVPSATTTASAPGAYGPMAGGYAGATTEATVPASLAGGGSAAGGVTGGSSIVGPKVPSLLHQYLPTIIGAGAGIAGTAIAAHGNSEASKAQAEAAERALQFTKEQYALQRQDTAPYRALGQGAVGNLGYLSGIDVDSKVPDLSSTVPNQPYGASTPQQSQAAATSAMNQATAGTLSQLSQPPAQNGGMVQVRSPQGTVGMVPASQLQRALSMGGTQV